MDHRHPLGNSTTEAYLRIAFVSIAFYDYLQTQPFAWRFYKAHWKLKRLSLSCTLFFLIRLTSILVLFISTFGFFYLDFTAESCRRYYLLPPFFKVLQSMVSQAILGIRVFNISQRSRRVGWTLFVLFIIVSALQWFTNMAYRQPVLKGNCSAVNLDNKIGPWIFYLLAIVYDLVTTLVSVVLLLKYKNSTTSIMSRLVKMMLYDGIGYFIILTAANALNISIYHANEDFQSAAVTVGSSVTWIMSQKLLIHLHEVQVERRALEVETISQAVDDRDVSRVARSSMQPSQKCFTEFTIMERDEPDTISPEIQVHVERTVRIERSSYAQEMESYRTRGSSSKISYQKF